MNRLLLLLSVVVLTEVGCGKSASQSSRHKTKYPILTAEILSAVPDKELDDAILDHIDYKIGGDYDHEHKIVTGLSKGFQVVYSTIGVEAEVNNGGFNQYFWNSSGQFQKEAAEGYRVLGAKEHADLMDEAMKICAQEAGRLEKFKAKGTIEAFSQSYKDDPLSQCDSNFFKLTNDVSALRVKYIREHPELFVGN